MSSGGSLPASAAARFRRGRRPVDDGRMNLSPTRRSLHAVAELVLAGPQYRRTGTIRLRVIDNGFATIREPTVAVEGDELVAEGLRIGISERTCAELAAMLGMAAGKPEDLYKDGSGVPADEVLEVDSAAAAYLAECFFRGDQALRQVRRRRAVHLQHLIGRYTRA